MKAKKGFKPGKAPYVAKGQEMTKEEEAVHKIMFDKPKKDAE